MSPTLAPVALPALEAAGLVEFVPGAGEPTYRFRHPLIADAAYASLLKNERRALHGTVGETLERVHPDQLDQLAAGLALHFDEAGDAARAYRYAGIAGQAAYRRYALPEAIMLLGRAVEIARSDLVSPPHLVELYRSYGRALEIAGRQDEALAAYVELAGTAVATGNRNAELAALLAQAVLRAGLSSQHDAAQGEALSAQALALARELGDREAEAKALWCRTLCALFQGRPDDAIAAGEAALGLSTELGLVDQEAQTRLEIGHAGVMSARTAVARAHLPIAVERFRQLGNLPMLSDALTSDALRLYEEARLDEALVRAAEALRVSEESDNQWGQAFALEIFGYVALERAEFGRAIATWEEAIARAERAGYTGAIVSPGTDLAVTYALVGAFDRARVIAERALQVTDSVFGALGNLPMAVLGSLALQAGDLAGARSALARYRTGAARSQIFIGTSVVALLADVELALAEGQPHRGLGLLDEVIDRARERGLRIGLPDMRAARARALLALGRGAEAVSEATGAVSEAQEARSDRSLWPALDALAQTAEAGGDRAVASEARRRLRDLLEQIAAGIDDVELRRSFLARSDVRASLAGSHA